MPLLPRYDVNSKLLVDLANTHGAGLAAGQGQGQGQAPSQASDDFCFIPDGTMLLTSFVNMVSPPQLRPIRGWGGGLSPMYPVRVPHEGKGVSSLGFGQQTEGPHRPLAVCSHARQWASSARRLVLILLCRRHSLARRRVDCVGCPWTNPPPRLRPPPSPLLAPQMANLQSCCAGNARLRLTPPAAGPASAGLSSLVSVTGEAPSRPTPDGAGLEVPLGFLQYGQPRQVVLRAGSAASPGNQQGAAGGLPAAWREWRVEALYEPLAAGQGAAGGAVAVATPAGPPSLDVPVVTQQLHRESFRAPRRDRSSCLPAVPGVAACRALTHALLGVT